MLTSDLNFKSNNKLQDIALLLISLSNNESGEILVGCRGRCYSIIISRKNFFDSCMYYATVLDFPTRQFRELLGCPRGYGENVMDSANKLWAIIQSLDMEPIEYYS